MTLPLENVKVLDFSQIMAGPYCCMLLGDMGADVIKVEPPGLGDQTRRSMGFRLRGTDGPGFLALNRNKRSIELDLKSPAGLEAFLEIIKNVDVLVQNSRPGVTERLGIDYESLAKLNPKLVYASISGFGPSGPWAARPGLDLIAQAASGVMSVTGFPDGPPVKGSVPIADLGSGLFCAYGILSALLARNLTGKGQKVDTSLFETAIGLSVWEAAEYWGTGIAPVPLGSANRMSAPYQAVLAADRYFVVGATNSKLWNDFCKIIGRDELNADERFHSIAQRIRNRDALIAELETTFKEKSAEHWIETLLAGGIPAGPILDYSESLASEQAQARHMCIEVEHPIEGRIKTLGFPVKLSETPQVIRHAPPLLGQHTDEILNELGLSGDHIAQLRAGGAFGKVSDVSRPGYRGVSSSG